MNELEERIKCNYPIGDLFICIQNEWTPMDVVEIMDYMQIGSSYVPVGKSVINGGDFALLSKLVYYSRGMVELLKKLDPYERYALCANFPSILDKEKTSTHRGMSIPFEVEESADEINACVTRWLSEKYGRDN